jgi:hypothetical protein
MLGMLAGAIALIAITFSQPAWAASEIENFFVSQVKAKFEDAPATQPGRERRMGRSADGIYLIELVGKPNPHTVTIMAGVTKANLQSVVDLAGQASFLFLDWQKPAPWLAKAVPAALNGKPGSTKTPEGAKVGVTSMMPASPILSVVLEQAPH